MPRLPLEKMDPNAPMTLKHFKADDFHVVCGLREEFRTHEPDAESGHGFLKGDRVMFGRFNIGSYQNDMAEGLVTGIKGDFVRICGELYHHTAVKKLK